MWPFDPAPPDDPWNGSWVDSRHAGRSVMFPRILRLNESARSLIAGATFTYRLDVAAPLLDAGHDGMPYAEEVAQLVAVEDILVRHLEDTRRGILALTISTQGLREFIFYVGDPDWAQRALDRARAEITTYELQSYVESDPEWRKYRESAG